MTMKNASNQPRPTGPAWWVLLVAAAVVAAAASMLFGILRARGTR